MVNFFIYAKDYSGSTEGVEFYHHKGMRTLEDFEHDVKKIQQDLLAAGEPPKESKVIYLHWNSDCVEVDEGYVKRTYKNLQADMSGTRPESIIECLKEKFILNENDQIKLLYIITDGLIGSDSVNQCFEKNENMHYETVVFHALNENLRTINLSVAASFFKGRCMVYRNYELYDSTDISKDFDYDKINVDNFQDEKDEMVSYIKLKFIRNFKHDARALQEIDKLKKLRSRLFKELSSKTGDDEKTKNVNLDTKDRNVFLSEFFRTDWYKSLGETFKVEIEKTIATLINYIVSDAKSYSFDALKFDTTFVKPVENEEIDDTNITTEEEIEFPDIILTDDKGIPVVILTEFKLMDKIIFHGERESSEPVTTASFSKFKTAMECPLFLVNDQDISDSIGYFYTLNVYKQLLANNKKTEPRTRKPFHGGLVLTSTDQFDKYNDYILSLTYFNGKKVKYNIGLFYYVLWKNCENKEWMDRNVVEQFKKYVMRRISETVCKIGLSCLPLDPQENVSLLTALWYCVEMSSRIFKDDAQNFKQERLRMYHGVSHHMIDILKHFEYDLDLKAIEKRRELITYVMTLKRIQTQREKVYYIVQNIFKTEQGFLISEIEKPFNLYKLNYLKFDHKKILLDDVVNEEVHLNNYVHLMYYEIEGTFEICEKTFRPFFAIDRNKSFYTELSNNSRKVVINNDHDKDKIEITYEAVDSLEFDRIVSLYKLFSDCVIDSGNYPTLTEYINYVSKKKKFHGYEVTIFPKNIYTDITRTYEKFQKIINNVDIKDFIKASKSNVLRLTRIKAEQKVKFNDDDEISEFILNEETRVNLKKKT
ncbi:uncharacterized protein [Epargyreus clarus]|uniref:uncharacterized protein n=1 Tax=Epargyreus clarus TaxID=520877 RepID=UPI003C2D1970